MHTKPITIAIDGYSSCGKSTIAKKLAASLGYIYIDSGAMYRAITYHTLHQGLWQQGILNEKALQEAMPSLQVSFTRNKEGLLRTLLNGVDIEEEIRTMEVSSYVSPIATLSYVREAMTRQQQAMGEQGGIVMDGRDVGTAVFPQAELKIFVTARPEVRAMRRYKELQSKGDTTTTLQEVANNLQERDRIDSTRAIAPLRKAEDARTLDNSDLSLQQQDQIVLAWANEAIAQKNL